MADPQTTQRILARLNELSPGEGWTEGDRATIYAYLVDLADQAEAGDLAARTELNEFLGLEPTGAGLPGEPMLVPTPAPTPAPTPTPSYRAPGGVGAEVGGWELPGWGGVQEWWQGLRAPKPAGVAPLPGEPETEGPWAPETWRDPTTGRTFVVNTDSQGNRSLGKEITTTPTARGRIPTNEELRAATRNYEYVKGGSATAAEQLQIWQELSGIEMGAGTPDKYAALARYEAQYGPLSPSDRQRFLIGFAPAGGGAGGMSEYQAGELDISRQRLGLEQRQSQIQAARTGQPLTYLSLIRGGVPGMGATGEIYQGLRRSVPPILGGEPTGAAEGAALTSGAGGWEAPPMPPGMAAIQAGEPIGYYRLPEGTLRPPGPMAQARQSPFEKAAELEAVEYQGVPGEDWQDVLRRIRASVGGGLPLPGYGGRLSSR